MPVTGAHGPIRVLVANQPSLTREVLQLVLDPEIGFDMVDHASGRDAVMQAVTETRPDVLLVDLDLDAHDVVSFVAQLSASIPALPIVLMADGQKLHAAKEAMRAGAACLLTRRARLADLYRALRVAVHGERWVSDELLGILESP